MTGGQGFGSIPTDGSTVTINTRKIGADNFSFNPAIHKFRYLTSTTEYNLASNLLADPNIVTLTTDSAQAPTVYSGSFTMPVNTDPYLYLIYDYREVTPIVLCYSNTSPSNNDFCCECSTGTGCTPFLGSTPAEATINGACALVTIATTYYHSGTGAAPEIGDTVYREPYVGSGCLTDQLMPDNYYKIEGNKWILVTLGVVTGKGEC